MEIPFEIMAEGTFVRGIIWLQVIRDGIPQLVSTILFAFFRQGALLFLACVATTG